MSQNKHVVGSGMFIDRKAINDPDTQVKQRFEYDHVNHDKFDCSIKVDSISSLSKKQISNVCEQRVGVLRKQNRIKNLLKKEAVDG